MGGTVGNSRNVPSCSNCVRALVQQIEPGAVPRGSCLETHFALLAGVSRRGLAHSTLFCADMLLQSGGGVSVSAWLVLPNQFAVDGLELGRRQVAQRLVDETLDDGLN